MLYLQQNKLKSLPTSLGNLTKLTTLNLSENALKVNNRCKIGENDCDPDDNVGAYYNHHHHHHHHHNIVTF